MDTNIPKKQKNQFEINNLLINSNRQRFRIKKIKSHRARSVINEKKEKGWNNRFIYNNDQKNVLSRDTSDVIIRSNKPKSIFNQNKEICSKFYLTYLKKFTNNVKNKENHKNVFHKINSNYNFNQNYRDNLYTKFSPKQKYTFSAKYRVSPFLVNNNKNIYTNNHFDFTLNSKDSNFLIDEYDGDNKKLNEIIILWNELNVSNSYKKYFYYIFKELDENDQNEMFIKETKELFDMKNNIKILCYYIDLRMGIINKIYIFNQKLNTEYVNNSTNNNDIIINSLINQIANEIEKLREVTINVISTMRKLKNIINSIEYLGKYNIDIISQKYKFDKNYILKMKQETNFLKEGCASTFFNLKDELSPFFLKAAKYPEIQDNYGNSKIIRNNFKIIPINECLINEIKDCNYYIYQELIAYQNEKVSQNNFRCISPIKKYRNINYEFNNIIQKDFERRLSNGLIAEKIKNQEENKEEEQNRVEVNKEDKNYEKLENNQREQNRIEVSKEENNYGKEENKEEQQKREGVNKEEKNYEIEKNIEKSNEEEKTAIVNFPMEKSNIQKINNLKLFKEDNNLNYVIKGDRLPSFAPNEEKSYERKEKTTSNKEDIKESIEGENNIENNIENNNKNIIENNKENNNENNIENNEEKNNANINESNEENNNENNIVKNMENNNKNYEENKNENSNENNIGYNDEYNIENNIENDFENNIEDNDFDQHPLNAIIKQTNNKKKEGNDFIANLLGKNE